MSATSAPYGLKPVKLTGSQNFAAAVVEYPMTSNSTTGIYTGDLVSINSGTAVASTATPTTTRSANSPFGVCVGVRYTDATSKQEVHNSYFPANGVTSGHTNVYIKVVDDPNAIFQVQADGAVAASSLGSNAPLGNFSAGSTVTGNSKVQLLSGSVATTATLAVRIVGFANVPGFSAVGDAYTDVLVRFNQGVHAMLNTTGG
jgi:hypothetical protein